MTTDEFWALLDRTRPEDADPTAHAAAVTRELVAAGLADTADFAGRFDDAMDALYTWDLWGAAYLAFGGCGDDSFEYFRAWLIGQGRSTWNRARSEPDRLLADLLDGSSDPDRRWEELGVHDGEVVLYAGGDAQRELSGDWPSRPAHRPVEPDGDEWDEEDLPSRFPTLRAALPDGWWETDPARDETATADDPILDALVAGFHAAGDGDHDTATLLLAPLLEDRWEHLVALGMSTDVAYAVGIGRLLAGDPKAARSALARVDEPPDHVRRALAQVELAEGDLTEAERLLDGGLDAHLFDLALSAVAAQRTGRLADATAYAASTFEAVESGDHVPWDAAGAALQVGLVHVELGDHHGAARAVAHVERLTQDAPGALPLVGQREILAAGALRLDGRPGDGLSRIDQVLSRLSGSDLGLGHREAARCHEALDDRHQARRRMTEAIEQLRNAGEGWLAADAARELASWR